MPSIGKDVIRCPPEMGAVGHRMTGKPGPASDFSGPGQDFRSGRKLSLPEKADVQVRVIFQEDGEAVFPVRRGRDRPGRGDRVSPLF